MLNPQQQKDLNRLANYVRDARKQKGISQALLMQRCGLSSGWLGSLEAKTMKSWPKSESLIRLAHGLGVPSSEVFAAAGTSLDHVLQAALKSEESLIRLSIDGDSLRVHADLAAFPDLSRQLQLQLLGALDLIRADLIKSIPR